MSHDANVQGAYSAYSAYPGVARQPPPQGVAMAPGSRSAAGGVRSMEAGGLMDPEKEYLTEFTEIKIRHAFVRKVFTLLTFCLAIAFGLCLAGNLIEGFRVWLIMNGWFPAVMSICYLITALVLICIPKMSERVPINYFLLFLYATFAGFMLAGIGALYSLKILSMAIGTTVLICVACMVFACQVKYDFTKWYPYVLVGFLVIFTMSIVGWFVKVDWYQILLGVLGTLLFSFLLVLDTQMIIGGKRERQYSIDQYVPAVMTLFTDIINIFLYLLRIFSYAN